MQSGDPFGFPTDPEIQQLESCSNMIQLLGYFEYLSFHGSDMAFDFLTSATIEKTEFRGHLVAHGLDETLLEDPFVVDSIELHLIVPSRLPFESIESLCHRRHVGGDASERRHRAGRRCR